MIVLDTNVISETLKPRCDQAVRKWLNRQEETDLFTTAINLAELHSGVELLPEGRRRAELASAIELQVLPLFLGRCLSFDLVAASVFAKIFADMRRRGKGIGMPDCQIAAIAKSRGFAVATRDVTPFRDAGIAVINPWTDE